LSHGRGRSASGGRQFAVAAVPVWGISSKWKEVAMADSQLTLTAEERTFLADLLANVRKETLIEEHRTRSPSFREFIEQREEMINSLLTKLGKPPA
jgi:hypothetical protein